MMSDLYDEDAEDNDAAVVQDVRCFDEVLHLLLVVVVMLDVFAAGVIGFWRPQAWWRHHV